MRKAALVLLCCAAIVLLAAVPRKAQEVVKIGLLMTYSGQFTDAAAQMDATGSPDKPDAGADLVAAIDSGTGTDAEDDASLDAYPDGIRG